MPRSFSGGMGSRPSATLFRVPMMPEKQLEEKAKEKPEDFFAEEDADGIDELKSWVDSMLDDSSMQPNTLADAVQSPQTSPSGSKAPLGKPPPPLLLSAFDHAMVWGATDPNKPVEGVKPPCVLSGPGAGVAQGAAPAQAPDAPGFAAMGGRLLPQLSGALKGGSMMPPPPLFSEADEAVFEVRASDSVVLNISSWTAFGYSHAELRGQPLLAVAHPWERSELLHSLQVLLRMDEIACMMGSGGQGQAIRVIHRVIVGLGKPQRRPETVTVDSLITVANTGPGQPATTCIVRSRKVSGANAGDKFRMLPVTA